VPAQGRRLVYESGEWEVDLARRELRARGVPVPIGGRAFEIIEVLVQSAGELVTKNDLMAPRRAAFCSRYTIASARVLKLPT
jgi:DNA-binding winged helix-turn-helix (wHTH) protein